MNSILRKEATLDEAVTFFIRTVNNAQAKFEMIQICLRARFALEEDFIAQESSVRDLIFNSFDDSLKDKFNAHSAVLNKKYRRKFDLSRGERCEYFLFKMAE